MIEVVHEHECNGTGSLKTIDGCDVCTGVATYRILSQSTIKEYGRETIDYPFIEVHGYCSQQTGFSSQYDR